MAYAILRTKRLKTLSAACAHNFRTKFAKNVDPSRTELNRTLFDPLGLEQRSKDPDDGTYDQRLVDYYEKKGAKIREDSCMALEFVLSASPKFFRENPDKLEEWIGVQMDFLKKEMGDRLQLVVLHMDEKTPHLQVFVSVEETKLHKYKNRYGQGEKLKTTLNADRFNPIYLQRLQDRYARANKRFGLKRGLRNSKAVHTTLKEFAQQVEDFTKRADYTGAINKIIDGVPSFMGACRIGDIKNALVPVLNSIMKQAKAHKIANKLLPEKIEAINQLYEDLQDLKDELAEEKEKLPELKALYKEAINSKQADLAEIFDLKAEVKRLKDKYEPDGFDGGGHNDMTPTPGENLPVIRALPKV